MTTENQNFSMYQGETKNIIVTISNDDVINLDLTGSTVKWALVKSINFDSNVILKESPEILISGNKITIPLKPFDTENLLGKFYHACELTDVQGNVSVLFTGMGNIIKSNF
jgi:hypothetical protein